MVIGISPMAIKTSHIKILAPAGSYESLQAAIKVGCDAVYFGVTQLNMRAVAASNFDLEDLAEITRICQNSDVKAYLALNTILYEHDLPLMRRIIDAAKTNGVDAVIVSDFAAIEYAKLVGQPIHISTMQSISNYQSLKFFAQFSDVIILAREVTLPMMKRIAQRIVEEDLRGPGGELIKLEAFAHGALCIAVSGRCFMSLHNQNASASRGACRQECRYEYKVTDLETGTEMHLRNQHVMSPADLCTIEILDQIVEAGVSVLKFEGRGRPPEYVDTVVRCYKEALEAIENGDYNAEKIAHWKGLLEKVYNRNFSTGFYRGQKLGFWSETGHNQAKEERVYVGAVNHYYSKIGVAEVILEAHGLSLEDKLIVTGKTTGLVRSTVTELRDEEKNDLKTAEKKQLVTIKVPERVRKSDKVYLLRTRV
jgi:U32 family peptidase